MLHINGIHDTFNNVRKLKNVRSSKKTLRPYWLSARCYGYFELILKLKSESHYYYHIVLSYCQKCSCIQK